MASNNFINECKNRANANRLGKIIIDGIEEPVTNSNKLQSFSIDSGCYVDGNIIGSVYVKCLKADFITDITNLADKTLDAKIGVKYADLSDEYINMGKYIIERPNNEITANMSNITAYDSLYTNLDSKYICNIDYSQNNITLKDLYLDICNQLNLIPKTTDILNGSITLSNNPFTNGEKNRTVLQTIAKISCSFVDIDNDTNKIDLCWLSQNEEPDYIFEYNDGEKSQYSTVEGGQIICGPINCLIIKNSQIDDENVTIKDEESISLYGEHSITISEDYILYNAELRQQAITNIWNRVKNMKYVDYKLTTYYGKPFLKLGDKIRIYTSETEYFDTYVLKHNFTYDGTFTSVIEGPALTEQEIKTKQEVTLKELLSNTQITVDKQNKKIELLTTDSEQIKSDLDSNYYTKEQSNLLVQNSSTGLTNTFSEAGGNNVFRNTGLWFESGESGNPYEFWQGVAVKSTNEDAVNKNSILIQNGIFSQDQEVPNGEYTVSFKYKKLNSLVSAKVTINENEYNLDSLTVKEFRTGDKDSETEEYITQPLIVNARHISISFSCNTLNGLEIFDLMVNKGSVKLAYSQNQNETTTDTVNISKGITITSSNYNTVFKANANGIKLVTLNDDSIAYFTDKGLSTKELVVESKAKLCGTLVSEVGDQTWFTRL